MRLQTTAQLIIIALKFSLCYLAPFVVNVVEAIDTQWYNGFFMDTPTASVLVDLSNLAVVVHSATNWLIICWPEVNDRILRVDVEYECAGSSLCTRKAKWHKPERERHNGARIQRLSADADERKKTN